ncbi:MAG: SIS domain-containing protein [Erysipelotrichaceae bacterium]|nr:SIS domain-containing protein [Erysipelotrichaceae bacterium]MBR6232259.1 SIS domain-containing protein [Erysipelotrichaceae bacterium]
MKAFEKYFEELEAIVEKVRTTQSENIMKAARILADTTEKGGLIYGFGTGHSHLVVDDAFWRAATPANYVALLEPSATGNQEITKSYFVENTYGIGKLIVDYHRITPNDCMIIISNSGNNIAPVDAALRAKEKGIPVIAITNVEYSRYLTCKHSDGVKLMDIADVVLDNCSAIGDAAVDIEGFGMKVGSTSSIPNIYLQNAILTEMVEILMEKGIIADVYYNGHMAFMNEEFADHNDRLVDKYFYRIRNL